MACDVILSQLRLICLATKNNYFGVGGIEVLDSADLVDASIREIPGPRHPICFWAREESYIYFAPRDALS